MILINGKEVSCGAVLYTMRRGIPYYLLVEGTTGHIGFPKGHMEENETELETARREILEEVNIRVSSFLPEFRERYTQGYLTKRGNVKDVIYFLAGFQEDGTIRRQEEEVVNLWILPYEEAVEKVNRENEKQILKKAHEYVCQNRT